LRNTTQITIDLNSLIITKGNNNMKKLLIGTALASAMLVSTVAQAETKVSGYFETNFRSISTDITGGSKNSPAAAFGTEMDMNLKSTNELDNGMTLGILVGTSNEGGSTDKNWGTDSYEMTLSSGDSKFGISTDRGPTIDMVHDVIVNPVDQPVDNHSKIGGSSFGAKGVAGATTDIQGKTNLNFQQKYDTATIAVAYMPSSGNTEGKSSSNINDSSADYTGYSIAGKFTGIDGLTLVAGMEKESEATLQDAKSTTYGASYTMGAVSFGAQKTNNDERLENGADASQQVKVDYTGTHYGIAYKVSDALTVGAAIQKTDKSGEANDEEYQQIEAAYSLGALGIGMSYGQVENVNGVTGTDADQLMIRLSSKM
jgi:hypothetical protein